MLPVWICQCVHVVFILLSNFYICWYPTNTYFKMHIHLESLETPPPTFLLDYFIASIPNYGVRVVGSAKIDDACNVHMQEG